MPVIEEASFAPVATIFEIETFCSVPGVGICCARPRLPKRMKIGTRTPSMATFETTTRSIFAPSTDSIATPAVGRFFHLSGWLKTVQFVKAMFLKSPLDSVPSLNASDAVLRTQLVTVMFSVERRFPSAKLVLGQMQSSHDSM